MTRIEVNGQRDGDDLEAPRPLPGVFKVVSKNNAPECNSAG